MIESEIQKQIIRYLELQGYLVFRMNAGKTRYNVRLAPPGTPDLLCLMNNGRSLWIEVKQPSKKPTSVQTEFHKKLITSGHKVIVACSIDDVIEKIKGSM